MRPRPKPPPKGFNKLKGLLKSSKNEDDVDSEKAPQLGASEEQELKRLLAAAIAIAPPPLEKFRLLIIGKTGCGKTTILYKVSISNQRLQLMKTNFSFQVCGGNMVRVVKLPQGLKFIPAISGGRP